MKIGQTPPTRILFNEEDLQKLVTGEIVKKDGFEIALQDIGLDRIVQHLLNSPLFGIEKR